MSVWIGALVAILALFTVKMIYGMDRNVFVLLNGVIIVAAYAIDRRWFKRDETE
jgi:ribose/xylose/arabinose/galactoside ABC-type transport system permease subunit